MPESSLAITCLNKEIFRYPDSTTQSRTAISGLRLRPARWYTGELAESRAVVDQMTSTGDMGYLDNAGRPYIAGREDGMIVSGGENVYPRALENALAEHPAVAENAVVGVPDEQFGRRLAAFIVPRPGSDIDIPAMREYLKGKVSRFEQPRDIRVVSSIPRNSAGKVLRRELTT